MRNKITPCAFCLLLWFAPLGAEESLGSLALWDLVDLSSGSTLPTLTDLLRNKLEKATRWQILSRKQLESTLKKYDRGLDTPCNDTQCAFEFGSMVQSKYLLFGTATRMGNLALFTLKLMDVKKAKVVWSKVFSNTSQTASLDFAFGNVQQLFSRLTSDSLRVPREEILAVLGFSNLGILGDLIFERIMTHAYSDGRFEIMSATELNELLTVLEIQPDTLLNSLHSVIDVGRKLGVSRVLFSHLQVMGAYYKHSLALFDVPRKSVLLSMPSVPRARLEDILVMEEDFFNALHELENATSPGR